MLYRVISLITAIVLMIIFSPLMFLIAIAVRLDSHGPAIFKQTRVGKDNRYFTLYKFRTMHVGTPDLPSDLVPSNDSRFTRTGKFLRRLSLDELPQLLNIIKGEMNFVGPRPALYNQEQLIAMRSEVGVHKLKPGVTGWAQVNGRDNITTERKVELDRYYADKQSLMLDLKIILLTVLKSFIGADLYGENVNSPDVSKDDYQSFIR